MPLICMHNYSIHAYKGIFVRGIMIMTYQNKASGTGYYEKANLTQLPYSLYLLVTVDTTKLRSNHVH